MKSKKVFEFAEQLFNNDFTVLPVEKGEKKPLVPWQVYEDEKPTNDEIKQWFDDEPNIAVLCGTASSFLLGLDFDRTADYYAWERNFEAVIPKGYVERTARGFHAFFRLSEPIQKAEIQEYEHTHNVEVAWRGRYIVIAPSLHKSGKAYEAISGDLTSLKPIDPKSLGLQPIKQNSKTETAKTETAEAQKILQGERNNCLFKIAVKMSKAGISQEAILAALQAENTAKCVPPLDDEEIQTIVKSAGNYQIAEPQQEKTDIKVSTIQDVLAAPEVTWLIEDVLYQNSLTILDAYPGKGKTLLALQMSKAVASGQDFLGSYAVKKGSVLIIDQENPVAELRSRIIQMHINPDYPIYFMNFSDIKLDNAKSYDLLLNKINEINPSLIVFDSLIRFHNSSENDASEMSIVMERLRAISNAGHTVLVIHHKRKGSGRKDESARGSSDIIGSVDFELVLSEKNGMLELSSGKSRREAIEPIKIKIAVVNDTLGFYLQEGQKSKRQQAKDTILKILEEPKTLEQIQQELNENELSFSKQTLREMLSNMPEVEFNRGERGSKIYKLKQNMEAELRKKMRNNSNAEKKYNSEL
jgi:RecA-family ATPase